ncbi:MAG: hypothetical protein J0I41_22125 [Filimonas sp.]|nr:hypothetical protein [Filimonas sp.]
MKAKLSILALILTGIAVGCKKDVFTDRPYLAFKSISGTVIGLGGGLEINLDFADKDGDMSKDTIWTIYTTKHCANSNYIDSMSLPNIPARPYLKGTLTFTFSYGGSGVQIPQPSCSQNDTGYFRFFIRNGSKRSDTISTPQIVVLK